MQEQDFDERARQEAEEILSLSDKQLYVYLATDGRETAFTEDMFRRGKGMYEAAKSNLKGKICADTRIRNLCEGNLDDKTRRILLVLTIIDIVKTQGALAIAGMIVREGVESMCKPTWGKPHV